MKIIKNQNTIIAENLFDLLKMEFAAYINYKLGSNLRIDYAHVYDTINIYFPEVIEGIVFTIVVTNDELNVSDDTRNEAYNTELLEQTPHQFPYRGNRLGLLNKVNVWEFNLTER